MAAPMVYDFCALCRRNHTQKARHVYTKSHTASVKHALFKFSSKVAEARKLLTTPEVKDVNWEEGATFWCYFCGGEYERHTSMDICTIRYGGLIKHISMEDHRRALHTFWFENHVKKKKKIEKYCMTEEEEKMFRLTALSAMTEHEKKVDEERRKEAHRIKILSDMRKRLVTFHQNRTTMVCVNQTYETVLSHQRQASTATATHGVRTVAARAEGLSSVNLPQEVTDEAEKIGNIHTGALPPWLQETSDDQQPSAIGPSKADLDKHLALEIKQKLPPNRVGAKFNHKEVTGQAWMPSFGRVWNQNRRLNSRQQFMREQKHIALPSSMPTTAVPYKRKSAPITSPSEESPHSLPVLAATEPSQVQFPYDAGNPVRNGHGEGLAGNQSSVGIYHTDNSRLPTLPYNRTFGHPSQLSMQGNTTVQASTDIYPRMYPNDQNSRATSYNNWNPQNEHPHDWNDSHQERPWLQNLTYNKKYPNYDTDSNQYHTQNIMDYDSGSFDTVQSTSDRRGYKRQKTSSGFESEFSGYEKKAQSAPSEERIMVSDSLL